LRRSKRHGPALCRGSLRPDRDHFQVAAWSEINAIARMAPMKGIQ
jgi:hypothetical protein